MTKIERETRIVGALAVLCGARALILRAQWPPDPRNLVPFYVFAYDNGRDQYVRATVIAAVLALACLAVAICMARYRPISPRPARALAVLVGLSVAIDLSLANLPDALVLLDLVIVITALKAAVSMRRGINPTTHAPR